MAVLRFYILHNTPSIITGNAYNNEITLKNVTRNCNYDLLSLKENFLSLIKQDYINLRLITPFSQDN